MTRYREYLRAAGLVLLLAGPVRAQKIYFTDVGGPQSLIHRSNLDGTNVEDLVTSGLTNPFAIALDVGAGKMYWTDFGGMSLKRSNLDGSDIQTLGSTLMPPTGIGLDLSAGKVYWAEETRIRRANLDGTIKEVVIANLGFVYGMALDQNAGKIYWTDTATSKIQRANLNGSAVEDLVTGLAGIEVPFGVALDLDSGRMYWTEWFYGKVQRSDLDGSNIVDL